jgi:hypothetical protein
VTRAWRVIRRFAIRCPGGQAINASLTGEALAQRLKKIEGNMATKWPKARCRITRLPSLELTRIHLVLIGMQSRTLGLYSAAIVRILIQQCAMHCKLVCCNGSLHQRIRCMASMIGCCPPMAAVPRICFLGAPTLCPRRTGFECRTGDVWTLFGDHEQDRHSNLTNLQRTDKQAKAGGMQRCRRSEHDALGHRESS